MFNMKKIFFLFILAGFQSCSATCCEKNYEKCLKYEAYCDNQTKIDVIRNAWTTAKNMTCLGKDLRDIIACNMKKIPEKDPLFNKLMMNAFWALEIFGNFPVSESCVFQEILDVSTDPCVSNEKYNKALENYGISIGKAVEPSVNITLSLAGCPVNETVRTPIATETSISKKIVKNFFKTNKCVLPKWLSGIVKYMNNSKDLKDRFTALTIVASSIGPLAEYHSTTLSTDEIINALKLKYCKKKIPLECCCGREEEVKKRMNCAVPVIAKLLDGLMKK